VAGRLKYARNHPAHPELAEGTVVCVITGHGLKDPDTALSIETEVAEVPADLEAVEKAMGSRRGAARCAQTHEGRTPVSALAPRHGPLGAGVTRGGSRSGGDAV